VTATSVCAVCGSSDLALWTTAVDIEYGAVDDRFDYLLCESCDVLTIAPMLTDRLNEIYPANYYSYASSGDSLAKADNIVTKMKARMDVRVARRALAYAGVEHPNILDVGGGSGELAATLVAAAGEGATATVVDIDADSIEAARQRGFGGHAGGIETFETDQRFDLVSMLNLIEHVADPIAMLTKARSLLSPTGVVWIQTPNFRALDARLFRHRSWTGLHCPRHFVLFSDEGLRAALDRAGLEPVKFQRAQGGSFWATSLLGLRRAQQGPPFDRNGGFTPLVENPLFLPLAAIFAAFDIVTRPLRRTSQTLVLARAKRS
jgi:SAM-dependent methyltransferase